LAYLKLVIGHDSTEQLRILFLDKKNFLIRDEMHRRGTNDHAPIYPREIAKRSLALDASAIIMVHNHPSGDLKPSPADLEQTKLVMSALDSLGITLHDHLIVSSKGHFSFKAEHLI
jgi:DNA repair protein RadC